MQKRPIILRSLLVVATPYPACSQSLPFPPSQSHPPSPAPLSLCHSLILCVSHRLARPFQHTHKHTHTHAHSLTQSFSLCLSLLHTHTHQNTKGNTLLPLPHPHPPHPPHPPPPPPTFHFFSHMPSRFTVSLRSLLHLPRFNFVLPAFSPHPPLHVPSFQTPLG